MLANGAVASEARSARDPERSLECCCGARCCAGSYPNPEWEDTVRATLAHVAPLLTGKAANERLHRATVGNVLTQTKETAVGLAERCGVHRLTVAADVANIEADLADNRHAPGRFDHVSKRTDYFTVSASSHFEASLLSTGASVPSTPMRLIPTLQERPCQSINAS